MAPGTVDWIFGDRGGADAEDLEPICKVRLTVHAERVVDWSSRFVWSR